ncbi:3-hydroxyisobutyryl-CoA hydrolase 1-like protein [Cinnamomum micranthum f. kanehirae]|uniref:3-hydroxyisobutyryl-CoA hydrolase n=1 Tax=Cinnamomum micranthum f. kanehirae TaxID=337451 RepID=A0A3S3MPH3_9MAGN|nr:3-hydroxyisobutyryl-CoA hydrolase 1-like protein [Cinnamomum micranthum f. kanehirae]
MGKKGQEVQSNETLSPDFLWAGILVEEKSFVRTITLNRPQKLNALSYTMISQLLKYFKAYEEDSNVKLVIIKGMGKAFSVGGDAKAGARYITEGHWTFAAKFYDKQLSLNYVMATYRKPQVICTSNLRLNGLIDLPLPSYSFHSDKGTLMKVSLIDGIVMGGGAGASMHGKFRVVTENTVFSMPETSLGLFPDVGASYFLSRLPGFLGEYLGLTGARLDGAEMLACGLATHFVLSSNLSLLEEALQSINLADPPSVCTIIDQFSIRGVSKESSVIRRLDIVNKCFSKATVEEIILALEHETETETETEEWITAAIKSLKKASPINLKVFLRSIREGRSQNISQCLMREYRMLCHAGRGTVSYDFFEGWRAILFDKDKRPKWDPYNLESISEEMVDQYFNKVDEEDWEDLKIPIRGKLTSQARSKL